jgi:DNA-binding response OmpR family regulator
MSVPATKRRILVVDDNLDAAVSLSRLIALLGHDVNVARDGSSALFIARSVRPDFVLLDIGLPGSDGFQVAQALRREPGLAAVKIIAVTGRGEEEDRERSHEAGIDYYLLKPVDIGFLESLLGKVATSSAV